MIRGSITAVIYYMFSYFILAFYSVNSSKIFLYLTVQKIMYLCGVCVFLCKEKEWQRDSRKWELHILLVLELTIISIGCELSYVWPGRNAYERKFYGSSVGISVYKLSMFPELKKKEISIINQKAVAGEWWQWVMCGYFD